MKRFFMIFVILILFSGISFAVTFPEPQGRLVNDFTGTLSVQQRDSIEKMLRDYEQKTTNEIAVVIVPDLQGEK